MDILIKGEEESWNIQAFLKNRISRQTALAKTTNRIPASQPFFKTTTFTTPNRRDYTFNSFSIKYNKEFLYVSCNFSMLRLWKWYQNCLATHPVKTQVISSAFIWGIGDIAAQSVTHYTARRKNLETHNEKKELKINWMRVATTSLFGFGFVGPVGHFWYEGLDRIIRSRLKLRPNSFRFVATKVAMDGIIFGPLDLLVFFTYMGFSSGKSASQVKEDVKRDFLPALILEGGIWPFVQVGNFRYVPVPYQLLYVNFFCLLDSCFLSWIEQQQDAPWKQWFKSILPLKEQERQRG